MAQLYIDWVYMPATAATLRIPFACTNMTGSTVYVRTRHTGVGNTALPAGYAADTPRQHGALANGSTLYAHHVATRDAPVFSAGEYNENTELHVEFYSDSLYSNKILEMVELLQWWHVKSDDPAWTVEAIDDFEIGYDGWYYSIPPDWNASQNVQRVGGQGYASSYAIRYPASTANTNLQVVARANPSGAIRSTDVIIDFRGIGISDQWFTVAFVINGTGVSQLGFGFVMSSVGVSKKMNISGAKVGVSALCRHNSADNYWYFDKARWFKK